MKKNDLLLILATAIYSALFYKADAGINFFLFSLVLVLFTVIRDSTVTRNKSWIAAATGTLLSGACIAVYANGLSVFANIVSLGALSAFCFQPNTSIITSLFFSFYSTFGSMVHMLIDAIMRSSRKPVVEGKRRSNAGMLYVLPVFVLLIFFVLYKSSNPLFDQLTKKINFNFISLGWIIFTLLGFLLIYGFFYHKTIRIITQIDEGKPNNLTPVSDDGKRLWNLTVDTEYRSGLILLGSLNALLLLVNLLDINFIFIDSSLPAGLTYSDYVHQGTGTLILSIIIAIGIILFYFRGDLNFQQKKTLKMLAYAWILQNIFMVFSTAFRNTLYIEVYSLTYKRIGVYVWLLLALIGLVTTFVKIASRKSNWFLFRSNGWLFYTVLVISCIFNWDAMVANYNISRAIEKHKTIDKFYLLDLSDEVLPQLVMITDSLKYAPNDDSKYSLGQFGNNEEAYRNMLQSAINVFYGRMQQRDWRGWNYRDQRTYERLKKLEAEGKFGQQESQNTEIRHL